MGKNTINEESQEKLNNNTTIVCFNDNENIPIINQEETKINVDELNETQKKTYDLLTNIENSDVVFDDEFKKFFIFKDDISFREISLINLMARSGLTYEKKDPNNVYNKFIKNYENISSNHINIIEKLLYFKNEINFENNDKFSDILKLVFKNKMPTLRFNSNEFLAINDIIDTLRGRSGSSIEIQRDSYFKLFEKILSAENFENVYLIRNLSIYMQYEEQKRGIFRRKQDNLFDLIMDSKRFSFEKSDIIISLARNNFSYENRKNNLYNLILNTDEKNISINKTKALQGIANAKLNDSDTYYFFNKIIEMEDISPANSILLNAMNMDNFNKIDRKEIINKIINKDDLDFITAELIGRLSINEVNYENKEDNIYIICFNLRKKENEFNRDLFNSFNNSSSANLHNIRSGLTKLIIKLKENKINYEDNIDFFNYLFNKRDIGYFNSEVLFELKKRGIEFEKDDPNNFYNKLIDGEIMNGFQSRIIINLINKNLPLENNLYDVFFSSDLDFSNFEIKEKILLDLLEMGFVYDEGDDNIFNLIIKNEKLEERKNWEYTENAKNLGEIFSFLKQVNFNEKDEVFFKNLLYLDEEKINEIHGMLKKLNEMDSKNKKAYEMILKDDLDKFDKKNLIAFESMVTYDEKYDFIFKKNLWENQVKSIASFIKLGFNYEESNENNLINKCINYSGPYSIFDILSLASKSNFTKQDESFFNNFFNLNFKRNQREAFKTLFNEEVPKESWLYDYFLKNNIQTNQLEVFNSLVKKNVSYDEFKNDYLKIFNKEDLLGYQSFTFIILLESDISFEKNKEIYDKILKTDINQAKNVIFDFLSDRNMLNEKRMDIINYILESDIGLSLDGLIRNHHPYHRILPFFSNNVTYINDEMDNDTIINKIKDISNIFILQKNLLDGVVNIDDFGRNKGLLNILNDPLLADYKKVNELLNKNDFLKEKSEYEQIDFRVYVLRNLKLKNLEINQENVDLEVLNILNLRDKFADISLFENRTIYHFANDEIMRPDTERFEAFSGYFFGTEQLQKILKDFSNEKFNFFRYGDEENKKHDEFAYIEFKNKIIEEKDNITIYVDGHGGNEDMGHTIQLGFKTQNIDELSDLIIDRYNKRKEHVNFSDLNQRDIVILNSCYGGELIRKIYENIKKHNENTNDKVKLPILVAFSEYGNITYGDLQKETRKKYDEYLINPTIKTFIEMQFNQININPVIYVPIDLEEDLEKETIQQLGFNNNETFEMLV